MRSLRPCTVCPSVLRMTQALQDASKLENLFLMWVNKSPVKSKIINQNLCVTLWYVFYLQRLYKGNYEKTKAKIHIPPDMLDIVSARSTQKMISGVDYRKYLHQWICLPDMQMYVQARKVNEQLSDVSNPYCRETKILK